MPRLTHGVFKGSLRGEIGNCIDGICEVSLNVGATGKNGGKITQQLIGTFSIKAKEFQDLGGSLFYIGSHEVFQKK